MKKITGKIDTLSKIPEAYRNTIVPPPPAVKIELTSRCDLKCFFCATSQKLRKAGDMDFSLLRRILKELKNSGVKEIGFFYLGESLLYPRLGDAIRLAKKIGFEYVFLTTNGRLLNEGKACEIISAGLDSLKFSFNSGNREQYKETTGIDAFNQVITNIQNTYRIRNEVFRKTGHWCGLYASSIRYDSKQSKLMKEAIRSIKDSIDQHYWLPLYNQAGYAKTVNATVGNTGRIGALRRSIPCWTLFREGHITWDGILTGCCFSYNCKQKFGDLNRTSFMDAWNSKIAQTLRKAHLNKSVRGTICENCI